jgi:2-amino-4-hydroxy-6-hydroxymethyldihydropteridine diphosphokinase
MVLLGHTRLAPLVLLDELLSIERKLGRRRPAVRNAPRIIDIDLILYDGVRMRTSALTLPHPRAAQRAFVVEPLREIWSASTALLT